MGRLKQLMIESWEDDLGNSIAEALGISYLELASLEYELHSNESEDGLVYGYYIEFLPNSPKEILNKIERLKGLTVHLDVSEIDNSSKEYYDDQYEAIVSNKNSYDVFTEETAHLRRLNTIEVENEDLEAILKRQIYIGVIGTMEAFLSETFIKLTTNEEKYLKNFVKSHPHFKKEKFELRDIFDSIEKIDEIARKVMLDTIYHDLPKVREMYRATFEMEFPELQNVIMSVSTRHDLVHRNGRSKVGEQVTLTNELVEEVIVNVSNFIKDIANKLGLVITDD